MVFIRECDDLGNVHVPQNVKERSKLWAECMKACEGHLGMVEFDQTNWEVYGDIFLLLATLTRSPSHQVL